MSNADANEDVRWVCARCHKTKDLSGPHLAGKTSVRSDCWPCAAKRLFVRQTGNEATDSTNEAPSKDKGPVTDANTKQSEESLSNTSTTTPSPRGFAFNNTRYDNDPSGFAKLVSKSAVTDNKQPLSVQHTEAKPSSLSSLSAHSTSKGDTCANQGEAQWRCAKCSKVKDLSGPHLNGKERVRSDCWPCAAKRLFIKTTGELLNCTITSSDTASKADTSSTVGASVPLLPTATKTMQPSENPFARAGGMASATSSIFNIKQVPQTTPVAENTQPTLVNNESNVLSSVKPPSLPANFNPFASAKQAKSFLDEKHSLSVPSPESTPSITFTAASADAGAKQPDVVVRSAQPVTAPQDSLSNQSETLRSATSDEVDSLLKKVAQLEERINKMEKSAKASLERQSLEILEKISDTQRRLEEKISAEHETVYSTLANIVGHLGTITKIQDEKFEKILMTMVQCLP